MNSLHSPRNFEQSEPSKNRWLLNDEREEDLRGLKKKDIEKEEKDKKPKEADASKKEKDEPKKAGDKEKKTTPEQKQEKRSEVLERSLAYTKQYEDELIPKDPDTLAKLVVAERIVALNEKLHSDDDTPKAEQEAIEETLDYMCLLSEKLEEPDIEMPPEIEIAYAELLELTAEVIDENEEPREVLDQIAELLEVPVENDGIESQEEPTQLTHATTPEASAAPRKLALAAALTTLLNRIRHPRQGSKESTPAEPPRGEGNSSKAATEFTTGGYASHDNYETSGTQPKHLSAHETRRNNEFYLRPVPHNASEYHVTTLGRPHIHPLAAIALASIVAARLHRPPEISAPRNSGDFKISPSSPYQPVETAIVTQQSRADTMPILNQNSPASYETLETERVSSNLHKPLETSRAEQSHIATHPAPRVEVAAMHAGSDRKIEHMTLQSLLTLAHGVHLGYGQYLKEEFEKGNINKDGLIKVLKARAKGKDFSREYREQAAHYRQLKMSPEFLREDRLRMSQPPITDIKNASNQQAAALPVVQTQPLQSGPTSSLPRPVTASSKPVATNTPEPAPTKETPSNSNLWIAAIVVGLLVLGLLIWTLL